MAEVSRTPSCRYRVASLVVLTLDVVGLLLFLGCATIIAGKFRRIFTDLLEGAPLPALTQLVLSIPAAVYLVACAGAIAALIYKEVRIGSRRMTLIINAAALAVVSVVFVVLIVALFKPLIGTINALDSASPDSH